MNPSRYTSHHLEWEGISILVKWCPQWLREDAPYQIAHLELHAANREPLPMTATGYRSHFIDREAVEAFGGPVAYVSAWLAEAAAAPEWQAQVQASRQLSLF